MNWGPERVISLVDLRQAGRMKACRKGADRPGSCGRLCLMFLEYANPFLRIVAQLRKAGRIRRCDAVRYRCLQR